MSEHTPLTEAERIELGRVLNRLLDDDSSGPLEWHPCDGCQNGPCPCSGTTYLGPEMTAAVERIIAARTSTATADIGLRERVEATIRFLSPDHLTATGARQLRRALDATTAAPATECEHDPVYDRTIYECGHAHGYCRHCGETTEPCEPTADTGARDE